jgi:hypothetical protein
MKSYIDVPSTRKGVIWDMSPRGWAHGVPQRFVIKLGRRSSTRSLYIIEDLDVDEIEV